MRVVVVEGFGFWGVGARGAHSVGSGCVKTLPVLVVGLEVTVQVEHLGAVRGWMMA